MMKIYYLPILIRFICMVHFLNADHYKEGSFDRPLYPVVKPRLEGFLKVSDVHQIFYAVYGNPDGIPAVVLHGGPGAGCGDGMTQFFDLNRWQVIMFDQRGAMRSEPFGCMEENTPQHSIQDMEKLREHLGIEKWLVFGGSWGSSLALLYGQSHQERCLGFILRGVWLVREQDISHLFYGMGKVFPEAYEKALNVIPKEERGDLISAYCRRMSDPDPDVQLSAAKAFMEFDLISSFHLPNRKVVDAMIANDKLIVGVMKTYCHYAMNQFFLEPDQILSQMPKIANLPAIIVHGRWDAICLPEMAYLLHHKWPNSHLWMVSDGGHSTAEPSIASALAEATDAFLEELS